jgi:hypothetical protein
MVQIKSIAYIALTLLFYATHSLAQNNPAKLNQSIKVGKANTIKALVKISGGELYIEGGSSALADVNFDYNKSDWNPTISYTEIDNSGKLAITALSEKKEKHIDNNNQCSIQLNKKFNYSLGIVLGAGVANMNFSDFNIERALFKLGVGSFKINLANTSVPLLKMDAGIGEVSIDLSGKWHNDLKALINAGIGQINLIVPANVGVKIIVSGFLGDVNTPGYSKKGKEYTNKNYTSAKHTLEIKVNGSIGTINVDEQ